MSCEPKTLTQMTPREAWEHAWEQAIDACRVFEEEAAAKQLEAVRNLGRQMLDQDQEEEGVPVGARDETSELRAAIKEWAEAKQAVDDADLAWANAIDAGADAHGYKAAWERALNRERDAEAVLRRLAGGESEQ